MALIITIIILILLAAISINAVFKAGIIDTATDAAIKYEKEQYREKEILDDLDNTIKDALNEIGENTGAVTNNNPVFADVPVGTAVANTNDQMIIEAMATDADENDILTYTLWFGTSETDLEETTLTAEAKQGNTISFTQTGLDNDTRYYFKVAVSDGKGDVTSEVGNERTWCKGEYCEGVSYSSTPCTKCDSNHQVVCTSCGGAGEPISCSHCSGYGFITPTGHKRRYEESELFTGTSCAYCKKSHTGRYFTVICIHDIARLVRAMNIGYTVILVEEIRDVLNLGAVHLCNFCNGYRLYTCVWHLWW